MLAFLFKEISQLRQQISVLKTKLECIKLRTKEPAPLAKLIKRFDEARLKDPSLGKELTVGLKAIAAHNLVRAIQTLQASWISAADKAESSLKALDRLEEARRHDTCHFNQLISDIHAEYKEKPA